MTLGRARARVIQEQVGTLFDEIERLTGLSPSWGKGKIGSKHVSFELVLSVKNQDGSVETPESQSFKANHAHYGLKAEDLGVEFHTQGQTFTLLGCNIRAKRYPLLARRKDDGRIYKFAAQTVCAALGREMPPCARFW